MKSTFIPLILKCSVVGLLLGGSSLYASSMNDARDIINSKCVTCHAGSVKDGLSRISNQRKTPEGWYMTISRMERSNGLVISAKEKKSVIKYLSDTQGITPKESSKYRYILEQRPNYQEAAHDELFTEMCNRCHSAARIGLQRRTRAEWNKLVDFHISYFPTVEYQALGRDRDWLKIAREQMVPFVSSKYPLDKSNWAKWQNEMPKSIDTSWVIHGHTLGEGDFAGSMKLKKVGDDKYSLSLKGRYLDGRVIDGTGMAILYSGYELRATLKINGHTFNQVIAVDTKNKTLKGRMFASLHPEEGTMIDGISSSSAKTTVLSIFPQSIKTGTTSAITIVGNNLDGKIKLPSGVSVKKVIKRDRNEIVLSIYASSNAKTAVGNVSIGNYVAKNSLTTYRKIDSLQVKPSYAVARVGDGGGVIPKRHAVFEAYGFNAGADNKIGTKDDIPLGMVNASWSAKPFDATAKANDDTLYAGSIDSHSGRFVPSFAGPNPKRKYSGNNAGNLSIIASYFNGEKSLQAKSHLIVTIQSWINSPID